MKIIVNRGFDKIFARIIISNDKQEIISLAAKQDYCDLYTTKEERIFVKLRFLSTFTYTIALINSDGQDNVFYICPTNLFRIWIILNYMSLPGICLLFYVLKITTAADLYDIFFAGLMALWAVSLVCMGFCQYFALIRKKMFQLIDL